MLNNPNYVYPSLVNHSRSLKRQTGSPEIRYTFRETNAVADKLAVEGRKGAYFDSITYLASPLDI
ncbi:hypothetical protein H5410_019681 [Solanum commersonii]|uniref:Uncharacterized protein n=1 Tax=Solanum commersonii TaxID=4109 RepID=A0A9J5Z906_SOLCO|nr:hypothetical protein H5410_019681 [Solanum commersonii]